MSNRLANYKILLYGALRSAINLTEELGNKHTRAYQILVRFSSFCWGLFHLTSIGVGMEKFVDPPTYFYFFADLPPHVLRTLPTYFDFLADPPPLCIFFHPSPCIANGIAPMVLFKSQFDMVSCLWTLQWNPRTVYCIIRALSQSHQWCSKQFLGNTPFSGDSG